MSYRVKKAVSAYFDAIMHFNILEKDIKKTTHNGNVIVIDTDKKVYIKSIR